MYQFQGDAGLGQQHVDYPCLGDRRCVAAQQQLDVVIGDVVDPTDRFADEGFDVCRMLPDRIDQRVDGDLLGALEHDRLAQGRYGCGWRFAAVALSQHQSIVQSLRAGGATGRPGHPAIAVLLVDADPVIVGDEALVEAYIVLPQWRYVHLRLDRHALDSLELELGIQTPDRVSFILCERDLHHVDLIGGNRDTQAD